MNNGQATGKGLSPDEQRELREAFANVSGSYLYS